MLNLRYVGRRIALSISLLSLLLMSSYTPARSAPAVVAGPRPLEDHIIVSILSLLPSKVCLGQKLTIEYGVMVFMGKPWPDSVIPAARLDSITVRAQAKLGKVSPDKSSIPGPSDWKTYARTITYTAPRQAGKDLVTIAAFLDLGGDAHGQDLEFEVRPCKYRAALQATEKDVAFPTDAADLWKPILAFNAIGEFEQDEESNALKGNGTVKMWLDAIYLGPKNAITCDVTQMLSGAGTFDLEGEAQEDLSIDMQFAPMAFSALTVACQGAGGVHGSGGVPPSTGPAFAINITMPQEGGTQDYEFSQGMGSMLLHITVFRRS